MRIHSHYDNLKVSRDAPQSVIKAAYRTLSQQYHPDLSKVNDAARIMRVINVSYAVLSDPIERKKHDLWLDSQEKSDSKPSHSFTSQQAPSRQTQTSPIHSQHTSFQKLNLIFRSMPISIWLILGILIFLGFSHFIDKFESTSTYVAPTSNYSAPFPNTESSQKIASQEEKYEKPLVAPNGERWPYIAGYLTNYTLGNTGGLSTVTIDNTQQEHDLYVKLVSQETNATVRHIYIPKNSNFIISDIAVGNYELRYKDLNTGSVHKADTVIKLVERRTYDGIEYSNIRMTLYQVPNGNMHTRKITEEQF